MGFMTMGRQGGRSGVMIGVKCIFEALPPLKAGVFGQYQQLLSVQCCQAPKVKVQALKMHFTPIITPDRPPCRPIVMEPIVKSCGVCCEPVRDGIVLCQACPIAYHANCQKEWLSRRRHLMAPKCLYCFSPLHDEGLDAKLNVSDIYIHANSVDVSSLDRLKQLLPGVLDHIIRRPKRCPKDEVRAH